MNPPLPDLTSPEVQQPLRHSASCASISLALLETLDNILPQPPSLTLSVGSGPGLIEALLLHHFPLRAAQTQTQTPTQSIDDEDDDENASHRQEPDFHSEPDEVRNAPTGSFYGVEVKNTRADTKEVNRYLPPENVITVPGTWALPGEEFTKKVEGLLFIYPRQAGLIRNYLDKSRCPALRVVVWIGPRCDIDEFVKPLEEWGLTDSSVGGLKGDELAETACEDGTGLSKEASGGRDVKLVEDGELVTVYRRKTG